MSSSSTSTSSTNNQKAYLVVTIKPVQCVHQISYVYSFDQLYCELIESFVKIYKGTGDIDLKFVYYDNDTLNAILDILNLETTRHLKYVDYAGIKYILTCHGLMTHAATVNDVLGNNMSFEFQNFNIIMDEYNVVDDQHMLVAVDNIVTTTTGTIIGVKTEDDIIMELDPELRECWIKLGANQFCTIPDGGLHISRFNYDGSIKSL